MQTAHGSFRIPYPLVEDVRIKDIAHSLANLCRFGGHTHGPDGEHLFYSVAQHSVLVSYTVPVGYAIWGLMHDAAEAYIGDMIQPLKAAPELERFRMKELEVLSAIAERFRLEWPMPTDCAIAVGRADRWMVAAEARDLMGNPAWAQDVRASVQPPLPPVLLITPLEHEAAYNEFLIRFYELMLDV